MFDEKCLVLARKTEIGERAVQAVGDVVIADYSRVEFDLIVPGNLYVGEKVRINGDIEVSGEARIDSWSAVGGDLKCDGDVYLGTGVRIYGKLIAGANLDVGEDVDISKGFEAKGWITIRDPIPIIIYIFIYILQLIGMGRSDEVERIVAELDEMEEKIRVKRGYIYLPKWSRVTREGIKAGRGVRIFAQSYCKLFGNCLGKEVELGGRSELVGSIKAEDYVKIGAESEVGGSIDSKGPVVLGDRVRVGGKISAIRVEMCRSALVEGRIKAADGITFTSERGEEGGIEQELFERSVDLGEVLD
jgi:predicted acyltransferase (DUF342 family)